MDIEKSLENFLAMETTPTHFQTAKPFWESKLGQDSLELYVKAMCNGKRYNNGFKPETHHAIRN